MLLGMSAAAAVDLSDYPRPFIEQGEFSGSLVVGENALGIDTVGMTEIAMSLQAAATLPVHEDGEVGEVVLEDSFRIASGSSNLLYGQNMNQVRNSLTEDDLNMLQTTRFQDETGTNYDAEFRVNLPNTGVVWNRDSKVTGGSSDDPAFYVNFSGSETWSLDIIFPDPINLSDFRGEAITILGDRYTFGQDDEVEGQLLTLYKSSVEVSVGQDPVTVNVAGEPVTIEVLGGLVGGERAYVSINGYERPVDEGVFYTIGGQRVYIDSVAVFTDDRARVNFFLGAEKLVLKHNDPVEKEDAGNSDDVFGTNVVFTGGGSGSLVSQIRVEYTPRNHEEIFSEGLHQDRRGLLLGEEYVDPVFGQVKFAFTDRVPSPTSATKEVIEFVPSGTNEFSIGIQNFNGQEYNEVLLREDDGDAVLSYGSDPSEIYVLGPNWDSTASAGAGGFVAPGVGDYVYLQEDNRFILRGVKPAGGELTEYTRLLELTRVRDSATPPTMTLRDLATGGGTRDFSATGSVDLDAAGNPLGSGVTGTVPHGTFTYDGYTYGFLIVGDDIVLTTQAVDAAPLLAGVVGNEFVTRRGANVTFPMTAVSDGDLSVFTIQENTDFNGNVGASEAGLINMSLQVLGSGSDNRIRISAVGYDQSWSGLNQLRATNEDLYVGTTIYGTLLQLDSDSSGGDLTVYYPREQVYYNVFVGPATAGTGVGGGEGTIVGEAINPIAVGAAILDTEAAALVGTSNLIVVGGPCANEVAMELMGNPADCAAGFTLGEGRLKLFENPNGTVSLLVAGYSGADTRLAARVLASYAQHEGRLVGDEVVVTGTTIANVDISAPVMTEDDWDDDWDE